MQTTATERASPRDYRAAFDRFFATMGQGVNAYLERLSRADEVRRLREMSDEELARIGVRRDDIVRYVFRDKLL